MMAVAVATLAAPAMAEAPLTRAEYVPRLEKICKPRAEATQRAMEGARQDVREPNGIARAARKFARAAAIFAESVKLISKVPRPPADVERLKVWFKYLKRQEEYLRQIASELKRGETIKAQRLTARFIHNGNLANRATLEFGFNWCSFKFSRYG